MGLLRCQNILSPPEDGEFLWPVLGILQFFIVFSGDREREVQMALMTQEMLVAVAATGQVILQSKQAEATGSVWLGQEEGPTA